MRVNTVFEPYLHNLDLVKPRVPLNGNTDYCPRCGGYLIQDMNDLDCFTCGWRKCGYFHNGDFVNEGLIQELMYNKFIPGERIYIKQ